MRITHSDIKMPTGLGSQPFRVDLLSKSDYYPYGMKINDLSFNAEGSRYGYNGTHEQDKELNTDGNYVDFGNFGYDTRVAMRRNQEPLRMKFPNLSGYSAFGSNPIKFSDLDGNDLIVLNATKGANGSGHAALLIGSDKDGWRYYSKNGTNSNFGLWGPSDKHPRVGDVLYPNLNAFLTDEDIKVDGQYNRAFRITTSPEQDVIAREAALETISSEYGITSSSCIDVASDALKSVGLDPGYQLDFLPKNNYNLPEQPNSRFDYIMKNNEGVPLTKKLTPFVAPPIKRDTDIGPFNPKLDMDKEKNSIIPSGSNNSPTPKDNTNVEVSQPKK